MTAGPSPPKHGPEKDTRPTLPDSEARPHEKQNHDHHVGEERHPPLEQQSSNSALAPSECKAGSKEEGEKPKVEGSEVDKGPSEPTVVVVYDVDGAKQPDQLGGEKPSGATPSGNDSLETKHKEQETEKGLPRFTLAASLMPFLSRMDKSVKPLEKDKINEDKQKGPHHEPVESATDGSGEASLPKHALHSSDKVDSVRSHADVGLAAMRRKAEHPETAKPAEAASKPPTVVDLSSSSPSCSLPKVDGGTHGAKGTADASKDEKAPEATRGEAEARMATETHASAPPGSEKAPDKMADKHSPTKSPSRARKVDSSVGETSKAPTTEKHKADHFDDDEDPSMKHGKIEATSKDGAEDAGGSALTLLDIMGGASDEPPSPFHNDEGKKRPFENEENDSPGREKRAKLDGDDDGKDDFLHDHEKLSQTSDDTFGASTAPDDGSFPSKPPDGTKYTWESGEIAWGRIGECAVKG